MEGKIHKDVFSLFFSVWNNPDTKIYGIVKYLLQTNQHNSRTWAAHLRYLCTRYGLEDPLVYLNRDPPTKSSWKELIATRITTYFENKLRTTAQTNNLMEFLNTFSCGLRGRRHPALSNMVTNWDVRRSRPHLKFLSGNYLTYKIRSDQSGGSPRCRICETSSDETVSHVISACQGLADEREKILPEFSKLCAQTKNHLNFEDFMQNKDKLCQFILDPTSLNLPMRVSMQDPLVLEFFRLSRDFCHTIDKTRIALLKRL